MKYYFFVNPVAGQGKHFAEMTEKIRSAMEELNISRDDYAVYKTEGVGDGERKARLLGEKLSSSGSISHGLASASASNASTDASASNASADASASNASADASASNASTDASASNASADASALHALGSKPIARFYACGGDGTANEIINGVYGFDGISVGIIPIGTGNDTVRNFPDAGDFLDIKAQVLGTEKPIDVMEYRGIVNGKERTGYAVNMFNIGFDCSVVELAGRLKEKPLISGPAAYLLAIFGKFVKKEGVSLRIEGSGRELLEEGKLLLCAISNGSYCGGGIKSAPQSIMDDGYFDVNIVRDVGRAKFLKFLPAYKNGTHLGRPGIEDILLVEKAKSIMIKPFNSKDPDSYTDSANGALLLRRVVKANRKMD